MCVCVHGCGVLFVRNLLIVPINLLISSSKTETSNNLFTISFDCFPNSSNLEYKEKKRKRRKRKKRKKERGGRIEGGREGRGKEGKILEAVF